MKKEEEGINDGSLVFAIRISKISKIGENFEGFIITQSFVS